ncbi:MAG TPA: pyruvate dehydrogenase complex E1 component subunit beta [Candidatus Dormibacteraeota bacterium]|nr:pyruvate dehydrogenase complex E1 component subunit beta [Candidatus Dormibacteraeota bacterium]
MSTRVSVKAPAAVRELDYGSAINEAFTQLLERDPSVLLIGQGLHSPWYVGSSMVALEKKFGLDRVIDTPVSENGVTGIAIGAAMAGMHPVVIHPRMDFMVLATDQILNQAAKAHYMFGGAVHVPMVVRGIINRGGEQAAQHSQALQSHYMHIPGLKVVMPSTAYDAKGLLISSVYDGNPVIYIDDRWLYSNKDPVPEEFYKVPIGKGAIRRKGNDVTIVATSYMNVEALSAARTLAEEAIEAEVIDLRTVKPIDEELIYESIAKTGRLVVADAAWRTCGAAAEISALVAENAFGHLKAPIQRVTLAEAPAPSSSPLEKAYYPWAADVANAVRRTTGYS